MSQPEKIDAIYAIVMRLDKNIAVHEERAKQMRKELDEQQKMLDKLERDRERAYGIVVLIGMGISALFSWIFKKF